MKSNFVAEMKGIKKHVYLLITNHEKARNSDEWLESAIWADEVKRMQKSVRTMSAFDFLKLQIDGKLTSSSSIRRARRKLNEELPETRGESYNNRQKSGKETRNDIND